ncbi:GNAT family N-acetyltransferase [Candidatus Collierbacteria bacterium]|nr:GNAT family N-acetyltransferase [Candidatus Collierbacteria bacterium]
MKLYHVEIPNMASFVISQLTESDIEEIDRVEKNTWPIDWQAPKEKFQARIKMFPAGVFGLSKNDKLVGVTTSMRINFDPNKINDYHKTWDEITGNGFIDTHEPDGNTLYVVSVGVQRESQGKGYGQQLVAKQFELAKSLGCKYLMLGARLPKFRDSLTTQGINPDNLSTPELIQKAQEYLQLKRADNLRQEPEIRFYEKCGLTVLKLTDPDFGPDPESCNFGVIMLAEV